MEEFSKTFPPTIELKHAYQLYLFLEDKKSSKNLKDKKPENNLLKKGGTIKGFRKAKKFGF